MKLSRFAALAALGAAGACASSSSATVTPSAEPSQSSAALGQHGDSRLITRADLADATQSNLYDFLRSVRPRWFQVNSSVGIQGQQAFVITVFVDDTKLGEPETLRSLGIPGVKAVRYYDASASQQKFPGRGLGPVIQVIRE